jgi:hypothetical protein
MYLLQRYKCAYWKITPGTLSSAIHDGKTRRGPKKRREFDKGKKRKTLWEGWEKFEYECFGRIGKELFWVFP